MVGNVCGWLIISGFLLIALINSACGLKCYDCTEEKGKTCKNQYGLENAIVECSNSSACVRHWLPALKTNMFDQPAKVIRTCATPNYCEVNITDVEKQNQIGLGMRICSLCQTDLCNMDKVKWA